MYDWSEEQQHLFTTATALNEDGTFVNPLIKVEARAGAAKSSSLVELAKRYPKYTTIRYLVFGNANAAEARSNFKDTAIVSTLHALAYHYIFKKYKFPVRKDIAPFISYKEIPRSIKTPYGTLQEIIDLVNRFCESNILSLSEFANDKEQRFVPYANQILQAMAQGQMRITHSGYLKLFHSLVMVGEIQLDHTDILMVDEFGDITPQTLDIIKAYPADQKIVVGDTAQSIFSFMGCINGFKALSNKGITLTLSKSFRCSTAIAKRVEAYCKKYIDKKFTFKGLEYTNPTITTKAYITRNNATLISKMIKLNKSNTPYKLVSKSKTDQLFKLPLFLLGIKPNREYKDPELKTLQYSVNEFYKYHYKEDGPSCFKYLLEEFSDHEGIQAAIKILINYKAADIIEAKNKADEHRKSNANLILGTAFVFKGLTVDEAILDDELNEAVAAPIQKLSKRIPLTEDEFTNIKLYYVAATRARHKLTNARFM